MKSLKQIGAAVTASVLVAGGLAQAGEFTWNFDTDPATGVNALQIGGSTPQIWRDSGGNPGGFLAINYPIGGQGAYALFPDIDDGGLISAFELRADIRSGNSQTDRAADGFSISLARSNDPALANPADQGLFGGAFEFGTTTGIAICFDTWAGNILPDGIADIEGIIIRVDGRTINRTALATRHGACDDNTSLQTGPRDLDFWAANSTRLVDAAQEPESWANLCWQPLRVVVDSESKVSVYWKGRAILENFQTDFFPSPGRVILAGRTGGSNSHVHFDNVTLSTETLPPDAELPTVPGQIAATETGAGRVALAWGASTDNLGRVAYQLERDGVRIGGTLTGLTYDDRGVKPSTPYVYRVRAVDVSQNASDWTTVNVTTVADVATVGYVRAELFRGVGGTQVLDHLYNNPASGWPNDWDDTRYINGLSFGEWTNFGDTYGSDYGARITGSITPMVTGQYHFFVRSDDSSEFHINPNSTEPLDVANRFPDAAEGGCCRAFLEPGTGKNTQPGYDTTYPTTQEPVALTAGQPSWFMFVVKEGGGGDWGQVAWRLVGDTTPAAQLQPLRGIVLSGSTGDPVGTSIEFTQHPQSISVMENDRLTLSAAATVTSPWPAANATVKGWQQWLRNGQPVAGQTGNTFSVPAVSLTDNNSQWTLRVGGSGVTQDSDAATLTVLADTKPPTIVSLAQATDTFTTFVVTFDEQVTAPTATTAGNYTLDQAGQVTGAALSADSFSVTLTTTPLNVATDYVLTVNNVQDNKGLPIAANTQIALPTWGILANRAKLQIWDGFTGATLADMDNVLTNAAFPDSPNRTFYRDGLTFGEETNNGNTYGDNHLAMMRAWVKVPVTGQYRFFVRSDDASRLFVSNNDSFPDPKTATAVAFESACCGGFIEPTDATRPERTSAPISLTAGQMYGVVYLVKEGGGGDWGHVALRLEGDPIGAGSLTPIRQHSHYYGPQPTTPVTGGIAWVSFHSADDLPSSFGRQAGFTRAPDVGYTDLLMANGYDVTRFVTDPYPDPAVLNQFDLVVISRSVPSAHYQNTPRAGYWNTDIAVPSMVLGGYVLRPAQLGHMTGGTITDTVSPVKLKVNVPSHPVFAGVALDGDNLMVNDYAGIVTHGTQVQRGISVITDPAAAGGTVLAVIGTEGDPANNGTVISEWPAGTSMGSTPTATTLSANRLVFLTGSREQGISSQGAGIYDLTDDGAKLFLNAVRYLTGGVVSDVVISQPTIEGGNITLNWTGGGTLFSAPEINGPWAEAGSGGSFSEPISTTGNKYYRVQ